MAAAAPAEALFAAIAIATALAMAAPARAEIGQEPIHYSADKQIWHRKENRVELIGHAVVNQPGETLSADYEMLDLNTRMLDAKGNCVYVASDSTIFGEEMHFNLDTRTGTIVGGRVSNDKFTLSGERINKLGEGRFQTHWGEYSTCRDCPRSWTLMAEDVDMQFEGYAHMSNVFSKIDDVPAFWLPYLIVPMKTRRQTGLLFPSFSVSSINGLAFVVPFFWAINRSVDMTIGLGDYTKRGERVEWEGRYALSPRSVGKANFYFLHDGTGLQDDNTTPIQLNRWALDLAQTQELPFGVEEKLRLTEMSDNRYPINVGDVPGLGERDVGSRLSFSYASPDVSSYMAFERFRNLLNTNPDPVQRQIQFDPHTVQAFPTVAVTTNDRFLLGTWLVGGLTVGVSNFTRSAGAFDYDGNYVNLGGEGAPPVPRPAPVPFGSDPGSSGPDFAPGFDPIRKTTRVSYSPYLYTTFRPFDAFSVVPSFHYFGYSYNFGNQVDTLYRGYLLFQTDLTTQIERIYEYPDTPDTPRVKHLIRPILTYSYIDPAFVREDRNHPFLHQIDWATQNNLSGYNFDDYDIVPLDNSPNSQNYFTPLGNSLAMGFTTQLIRRLGKVDSDLMPTYRTSVELSAGEAINFREYEKGGPNPQPLSRFFSNLNLNLGQLTSGTTYYYYPYIPGIRHQLSTTTTYALERSVHQRLFDFDRSVNVTYIWDQLGCTDTTNCKTSNLTGGVNFSLSDYVLPSASLSYSFVGHNFLGAIAAVRFQSPSRCWRFTFSLPYQIGIGASWNVDLALNLTGSGFGGVSEVANQATAR